MVPVVGIRTAEMTRFIVCCLSAGDVVVQGATPPFLACLIAEPAWIGELVPDSAKVSGASAI